MQSKTLLSTLMLSAALAAGGIFTASVFAQEAAGTAPAATARALSKAQIQERLEAAGYKGIDKVERERYEVRATDRDGHRVKLDVDATTAQVIEEKAKRDRRVNHDENARRSPRNESRQG